jgi:hypothetical protein
VPPVRVPVEPAERPPAELALDFLVEADAVRARVADGAVFRPYMSPDVDCGRPPARPASLFPDFGRDHTLFPDGGLADLRFTSLLDFTRNTICQHWHGILC